MRPPKYSRCRRKPWRWIGVRPKPGCSGSWMVGMTPERYRRVIEIFQAAADRSSEARSAFLNQECTSDSDLRREVEKMLAADARLGGFLEKPLTDLAADLLDD